MAEITALDILNYRDVKMASNTKRIAEEKNSEPIATFEGAAHTYGIQGFLERDRLRKSKEAIYRPLDFLMGERSGPREAFGRRR